MSRAKKRVNSGKGKMGGTRDSRREVHWSR